MISAFRGSNRTCSEVSIRAGNHEICHLLYCFFPLLHNSLTTINVTVSKRLWCGWRELTGMQNYLVALAKWILVNFHSKFRLGIPNHNNPGSKNLEIPRNSQKFPEIPRNSKSIATQSTNDFPWKAVNLKNS